VRHDTKCYARGERVGDQSIQLGYKNVEVEGFVRRFGELKARIDGLAEVSVEVFDSL
jgi:hypothetical protein